MADVKVSRLQAEIKGLMDTLEERDQFIRKLSRDLSDLQNKNMSLESQLTAAANQERPAGQTQMILNAARPVYSFAEARQEIELMEAALNENLSAAQVNAALVSELGDLRLKRDLAVGQLAGLTDELAADKKQVAILHMENADLKERLAQQTQVANDASSELQIIKQRTDLSFTASQLSGYLSKAIDNFNYEANAGDLSVNYIINGMEMIFKASLTRNATGEMTLAAPSLTGGDESLSTVKLNITAIPKDEKNS